jgi:hypothetical protein
VNDIDGPIAFLNNGERICFWPVISENQFAVLSADADSGKNEMTLAKGQGHLPMSAVCSPDGHRAALFFEVAGISILDFKTGQRTTGYESRAGSEIYSDILETKTAARSSPTLSRHSYWRSRKRKVTPIQHADSDERHGVNERMARGKRHTTARYCSRPIA